MEQPLSAIQIARMVLRVMHQIKQDRMSTNYNSDDKEDQMSIAKQFIDAFSVESGNAKKRDIGFAMDLIGRIDKLLDAVVDGTMTVASLAEHC